MSREHEWRVRWEIDVTAPTPLAAAQQAREAQIRRDTTALVFDVYDRRRDTAKRVDLGQPESTAVTNETVPPFDPEYLKVALEKARDTLNSIPYVNGDLEDVIQETLEYLTNTLERG